MEKLTAGGGYLSASAGAASLETKSPDYHVHDVGDVLGAIAARRPGSLTGCPSLGAVEIELHGTARASFDKNSRMYDFDVCEARTNGLDWARDMGEGRLLLVPGLYAVRVDMTVTWPEEPMYFPNTASATWIYCPRVLLASEQGASLSASDPYDAIMGVSYNKMKKACEELGLSVLSKSAEGLPKPPLSDHEVYLADGSTEVRSGNGSYATGLEVINGPAGSYSATSAKLVDAVTCLTPTVVRPYFSLVGTSGGSELGMVFNCEGTAVDGLITVEKAM